MEPNVALSFKETVANLANREKPLSNLKLVYLSNLEPAKKVLLEQVWVAIEVKRRRQIMSRLVELAEDNFELNFDDIFRYCLRDEDAEVRCTAIEGLWENEETSLLIPLINLLEHDSSDRVQAAAASALGKFTMLAELNKLRQCHASRISRALLATFGDTGKPLEIRCRALEAVAPLSIAEVATAIMGAYQSDNLKLRASAIYAMGKNCSPSCLSILLKELGSVEDELRYEAAVACGELGQEEAVPYLVKLTNDRDINVQLAAVQALGKIGGRVAKEHLEQCLSHPDEAIRDAAKQTMDELALGEDPLNVWRVV